MIKLVHPYAQLIYLTEDAESLIGGHASICYNSRNSDRNNIRRVKHTLRSTPPHLSVLRHAMATFHIQCSRSCSHQIVRSVFLSVLQESQRYVNYKDQLKVILPAMTPELESLYLDSARNCWETYKELLRQGQLPEDARYVLPTMTATKMAVSGNFQAWYDFLNLRLGLKPDGRPKASMEIFTLATTIYTKLNEYYPNIFNSQTISAIATT